MRSNGFLTIWCVLLVVIILISCGQESKQARSGIYPVLGATCPQLTKSLVDYAFREAKAFFGEDVSYPIFLHPNGYMRELCSGVSCWSPQGVGVECGTQSEMCSRIMYEAGHQAAYKRFGYLDALRAEQIFVVYYQKWFDWPCRPDVAKENGIKLKE